MKKNITVFLTTIIFLMQSSLLNCFASGIKVPAGTIVPIVVKTKQNSKNNVVGSRIQAEIEKDI